MSAGTVIANFKYAESGDLELGGGVKLVVGPYHQQLPDPTYVQYARFGFGGVDFHYELYQKEGDKIEVRLDFECGKDCASPAASKLMGDLRKLAEGRVEKVSMHSILFKTIDCRKKANEAVAEEATKGLQRLYALCEGALAQYRFK